MWHWDDDGEYNMPVGEYKVYYIQEESDGSAHCFSDTIEIVYKGALKIASVAIASATLLYALI